MNNFKDFIYDISDLILGFVVVLIIAILLFININRFFLSTFNSNMGSNLNIIASEKTDDTKESKSVENINTTVSQPTQTKANDNKVQNDNTKPLISNVNVIIESDSSSSDIADILYSNDIIMSKEEFLDYIRKNNLENSLKSGTFSLNKSMTIKDIVNTIKK
jgi:hypothetical protein